MVISHQWWWEERYPQTGLATTNEIHILAGTKWLVRLESADVIRDFLGAAHGQRTIFDRRHDKQGPDDKRESSEYDGAIRLPAGEGKHRFQGVGRTHSYIAENHTQCGQHALSYFQPRVKKSLIERANMMARKKNPVPSASQVNGLRP